jgi:hypothetical protein
MRFKPSSRMSATITESPAWAVDGVSDAAHTVIALARQIVDALCFIEDLVESGTRLTMESREYRNGLLAQGYAKLSVYLLRGVRNSAAVNSGARCTGDIVQRRKDAAKNR